MYTIHHGLSPAYHSEQVNTVAAQTLRRGLRSASTTNYTIPRLLTKFGERALSYAGPTAWNSWPHELRAARTQNSFKRRLKTHLLTLLLVASFWFYWQCNAPLFVLSVYSALQIVSDDYHHNGMFRQWNGQAKRMIQIFLNFKFWYASCSVLRKDQTGKYMIAILQWHPMLQVLNIRMALAKILVNRPYIHPSNCFVGVSNYRYYGFTLAAIRNINDVKLNSVSIVKAH